MTLVIDVINIMKVGVYKLLLFFAYKGPILGLVGCSISGFSVGILWQGTFSMSAS